MTIDTQAPTLREVAFPWQGRLADTALIACAAGLTALAAQVAIPLPYSPVPVTGQTLAVLLAGAALGARRGAASQLAYLGAALAGAPVLAYGLSAWSPSTAGVPVIFGPTAGYLVGFVAAAYLTGRLAEAGWDRSIGGAVAAMTAGNLVIYAFGLAWLAQFVLAGQSLLVGDGIWALLTAGMVPFLIGDAVKIALAAAALPTAWALVNRLHPPAGEASTLDSD